MADWFPWDVDGLPSIDEYTALATSYDQPARRSGLSGLDYDPPSTGYGSSAHRGRSRPGYDPPSTSYGSSDQRGRFRSGYDPPSTGYGFSAQRARSRPGSDPPSAGYGSSTQRLSRSGPAFGPPISTSGMGHRSSSTHRRSSSRGVRPSGTGYGCSSTGYNSPSTGYNPSEPSRSRGNSTQEHSSSLRPPSPRHSRSSSRHSRSSTSDSIKTFHSARTNWSFETATPGLLEDDYPPPERYLIGRSPSPNSQAKSHTRRRGSVVAAIPPKHSNQYPKRHNNDEGQYVLKPGQKLREYPLDYRPEHYEDGGQSRQGWAREESKQPKVPKIKKLKDGSFVVKEVTRQNDTFRDPGFSRVIVDDDGEIQGVSYHPRNNPHGHRRAHEIYGDGRIRYFHYQEPSR